MLMYELARKYHSQHLNHLAFPMVYNKKEKKMSVGIEALEFYAPKTFVDQA